MSSQGARTSTGVQVRHYCTIHSAGGLSHDGGSCYSTSKKTRGPMTTSGHKRTTGVALKPASLTDPGTHQSPHETFGKVLLSLLWNGLLGLAHSRCPAGDTQESRQSGLASVQDGLPGPVTCPGAEGSTLEGFLFNLACWFSEEVNFLLTSVLPWLCVWPLDWHHVLHHRLWRGCGLALNHFHSRVPRTEFQGPRESTCPWFLPHCVPKGLKGFAVGAATFVTMPSSALAGPMCRNLGLGARPAASPCQAGLAALGS